MIQTFEDLCTYCYAIIEDIYREVVAPHDHRPGPAPGFTDAEVITLTLVAELVGLDAETQMHGYIRREKGRRALFPLLPSRCRFNRRRRMLGEATNTIRRELKARLWWALDPEARELAAIDSLPVPVVGSNHAPGEHRWHGHAAFGRIASKKMTIYGFKVHLTISSSELILDFALAPANHHDSLLAQQLLCGESDLLVLGDKAYIDEELKRELEARGNVLRLTRQRSNQKPEQSSGLGRAIDHFRQPTGGAVQHREQRRQVHEWADSAAALQARRPHPRHVPQPPHRQTTPRTRRPRCHLAQWVIHRFLPGHHRSPL